MVLSSTKTNLFLITVCSFTGRGLAVCTMKSVFYCVELDKMYFKRSLKLVMCGQLQSVGYVTLLTNQALTYP